MYQFNVPDMTCGHCISTITKAVKSEDPKAKVEVSLSQHLVKVESALSQEEIAQQITEAGYTPTAVAA
jgi:copper chaperone